MLWITDFFIVFSLRRIMKIMMIIIMVMSSSFCRLTSVDSVAYVYLKATDNTTVPSKVSHQPKL